MIYSFHATLLFSHDELKTHMVALLCSFKLLVEKFMVWERHYIITMETTSHVVFFGGGPIATPNKSR